MNTKTLKENTMSSETNATFTKNKFELSQEELLTVRDAIEKTLKDYYKKKSSIFHNMVNKNQ
jgi:hypothetical protein